MNRRNLLKVSAIAGGGMMLQMTIPVAQADANGPLVRSKELNIYTDRL